MKPYFEHMEHFGKVLKEKRIQRAEQSAEQLKQV